MLKNWTRVVVLNLSLTAAGLQASVSGKTTPCAVTSRLNMVTSFLSKKSGEVQHFFEWMS